MNDIQRAFPTLADPLGETLYQLRLDGSLYALSELTAPWGIDMPALPGKMMFHIVTSGSCWLQVADTQLIELQAGSLALLPHGLGHRLLAEPDSDSQPFFQLPVKQINERFESLHFGGGGQLTRMTCCVMNFDYAAGQQLYQLPPVLHIKSMDADIDSCLQQSLRFLAREAKQPQVGGQTIMAHLADILLIQTIRN